jgi:hypothetical protein
MAHVNTRFEGDIRGDTKHTMAHVNTRFEGDIRGDTKHTMAHVNTRFEGGIRGDTKSLNNSKSFLNLKLMDGGINRY